MRCRAMGREEVSRGKAWKLLGEDTHGCTPSQAGWRTAALYNWKQLLTARQEGVGVRRQGLKCLSTRTWVGGGQDSTACSIVMDVLCLCYPHKSH